MADNTLEKLIFQLIVETKAFTANLKKSLDDGLKMIQSYQKKASDTLSKGVNDGAGTAKVATQFEKLTKSLADAQKQFVALQKSTLGWEQASKHAGATSAETAGLYDRMTEAAIRQGKSIQVLAQEYIASGQAEVRAIQEVLAANGFRVLKTNEVSAAIDKLEANVNKAAKAEGVYVNEAKKVVDANDKIEKSSKKVALSFSDIAKAALGFAGINSIGQVLQNIVTFLGDAAKASLDYAQAQFTLAVNVRAAAAATGGQSGTFEDWQKRIQMLRKELKIFSETDITKAINQTTVLTRVLGLNADQQEQVIRIGATLAQMVGVDLAQGVDDVTKALGGSSVVLDKYGLFLRDADKGVAAFELGFTEKIEKGTNSLNSQELAMATLSTILKQVNPLMAELTGYEETLPGQIKEVDAAIADLVKNLGGDFEEVVLGLKLIYLSFLQFITELANNPIISGFLDNIKSITDYLLLKERLSAGGFTNIKQPEDFGLTVKRQKNAFGGDTRLPVDAAGDYDPLSKSGKGTFYTSDQLDGDKENIDAYLVYLTAKQAELKTISDAYDSPRAFKEAGFSRGGTSSGGDGGSGIDENFLAAQEDLSKDLVDNFNDMTKAQRDALLERNMDVQDANDEFLRDLEDINTELERKLRDLETDLGQKREDAARKYFRGIDDLERDEADKRRTVIEESNGKTEEVMEDYYRRLRELDNQYYFDLRDAVAENDAVAIKRLERKYAIDKQKITDNLQDRLGDEKSSRQDRINEIEIESRDRLAELYRRYKEELTTVEVEGGRRRDELFVQRNRELDDLVKANDRKLADIEEAFQEELDMIELHYQDKLVEITRSLSEQYQLEKGSLRKLFTLYDEYYGSGGRLDELLSEFYEHQNELAGEFNDSIGDLDNAGGVEKNFQVTTTSNGSQLNVVISGDGSIPDSTIEKLADEIAERISDTIETIVVTRGSGGTGR